jgi:hypothetical protein
MDVLRVAAGLVGTLATGVPVRAFLGGLPGQVVLAVLVVQGLYSIVIQVVLGVLIFLVKATAARAELLALVTLGAMVGPVVKVAVTQAPEDLSVLLDHLAQAGVHIVATVQAKQLSQVQTGLFALSGAKAEHFHRLMWSNHD